MFTELTTQEGETRVNPITGEQEFFNPEGKWVSVTSQESITPGVISSQDAVDAQEEDEKKLNEITGVDVGTETGTAQPVKTVMVTGPDGTFNFQEKDLPGFVDKGFQLSSGTGGLTEQELADLGLGNDEELTPQQQLLKDSISDLETEITDVSSQLDTLRSGRKDATNDLIDAIKVTYENKRKAMMDINKRSVANLQKIGIREGSLRYSTSFGGIISAEETKGLQRLSNITAEMNILIAEAKQAQIDKDYSDLHDKMTSLDKKHGERIDELKELYRLSQKKNEEIEAEKQKMKTESSIITLFKTGITNATDIYSALDEQVPIETIDEVLGMIEEDKKITDLDRIQNVKDLFSTKDKVSASSYLEAQQKWIADGGTISDFKAAFPPEAIMEADELSKLPRSVYIQPKETIDRVDNADRMRIVGGFIEKSKGEDGLITAETYISAQNQWIAENGSIANFKAVYPPETLMDEDNLNKLPSGLKPKEPTISKTDRESIVWQWLNTDEAKALNDDEKRSQIMSYGLNPQVFGIY